MDTGSFSSPRFGFFFSTFYGFIFPTLTTFNKNGDIESKYEHYPKFFGVNYYYYYDIHGRLLLEFESTPDGPGGKYTYYEYSDNKGKYPIIIHQLKNISFLEENDDIRARLN